MNWTVLNRRKWIEGTFATLWIGNRSDTGALVIVKCLRDKTPDNRRYFSREGRVLRGRFHQRMVEFLGGDLDGPDPYYIMPYYDGGQLTAWAGKMTHVQLRLVALQISETLANLHAAEVIHGDVKPDNTFVTKTGDLRVGDPLGNGAGCTIVFGANSGGTPGYWAPEVAARLTPISKQGDVFSFGATILHLLTGRVPQDDQNLDPKAAGVVVPDDIRNVILACCKRDPNARPTMAFIFAALQEAVMGPRQRPAPPPVQKNDAADTVAAIGGIALVVGLLAALFGGNDRSKRRRA